MSTKRVQDIWSASDHPWSSWVKRPLFASLSVTEIVQANEGAAYRSESAPWTAKDPAWLGGEKLALVLDLPGPEAIETALAFGRHGFRPVLMINAASAAREAIDMRPVLHLLAEGARFRSAFPAGPDVAPAFILDSRREGRGSNPAPAQFDNRWTVFPSDLPPVKRFRAAGIRAVVILQEGVDVKADVQALAWTYLRGGLDVRLANVRDRAVVPMSREAHGWRWLPFTLAQLRRRFTLRRRWDGSYGHYVPIPPLPSHG